MARAAFLYLDANDAEATLVQTLRCTWPALAAAEAPDSPLRGVLSSPQAVVFDWLKEAEAILRWPTGRVFGRQGELRWWTEDQLTHATLVTDLDTLPQLSCQGDPGIDWQGLLALEMTNSHLAFETVRLWGSWRDNGTWRDPRVPDSLHYPIQGDGRDKAVVLCTRHYMETGQPDDGSVQFVRYYDLIYT